MTNSSEDLLTLRSFISMTIHICIYKHISLLTKVNYLCKKLLNPLTGDFCIVQQKWTGQFFTQLQIWLTEFYLHRISKLLVRTPVHGKYLYLYESRELIFSNTLLSTTSTLLLLIIPLLQPSAAWQILLQKVRKPSCSAELGEGSSKIPTCSWIW